MQWLWLLIGFILGIIVLIPKVKQRKQRDEKIDQLNFELERKKLDLETDNKCLELKKSKINQEIADLFIKKEEIKELADEKAEVIYQASLDSMQNSLSEQAEKLGSKYQEEEQKVIKEYEDLLAEQANNLSKVLYEYGIKTAEAEANLKRFEDKLAAAIEASRRDEEKELEQDKYKIILTTQDLSEIAHLRSVIPYLRQSRPVCKIIWESYYRTPTNELLNRIMTTGTHCGIYKITNLHNNKVYIGQSVNVSDRLIQHIKCGIGIDTTNQDLYKAMNKYGVENFTFELLEECKRQELNDRETFWIEYYKSQNWGYNMSKGGAKGA